MKNFTKSLFVALLLLCSTVASAHDFVVGGIYYNITDATAKTVAVTYKGSSYSAYSNEYSGSVSIPSTVTYNGTTYSVTSIGSDAFYGCTGLTSVAIPNSVTSIGSKAFYQCYGLTAVYITDLAAWCNINFKGYYNSNPLCYAENLYLNGEKVTNLVIPDGITEIKNYAFYYCKSLTSVTIPNSVTSIGNYAFYDCWGLTSITIPNSVTSIGSSAFSWCYGLTSVTIPNSVTSISNCAFSYCTGLRSVTIPNSVTSIGSSAFSNCWGLTSITIPNSVTSIGSEAFYQCYGLTSVTIPASVTSIGEGTFSYCTGLKNIDVNSGNTIYDSRDNCNAIIETATNALIQGCKSTIIPNSVTSIGSSAFEDCTGLTSVTIPNSVTSIGSSAFSGCTGLTGELVIPASVTSIGDYAFYDCTGLTGELVIPAGVTSIGNGAFYDCTGLTGELVIPAGVTSINSSAFYNCTGLTGVTIPNNVTRIDSEAFYGCTGLTGEFFIPASVTSIGNKAFYGNNFKTVYNSSSLGLTKGSSAYGYVAYYADKVINGSLEGDFFFTVIDSVNTLVKYFGDGLTFKLPDNYNGESYVIDGYVFRGKIKTTGTMVIPDSVAGIGDYAFADCSSLDEIKILDGVKNIGASAFSGCSNVETLYISSAIESIGDNAFAGCNNLFEVRVGSKKAITASDNVFSEDAYNNACLYVPTGRKFAYERATPWCNFYIAETDFTSIDEIPADATFAGEENVWYDLSGRRVEGTPKKGVYIINGKKVIIK